MPGDRMRVWTIPLPDDPELRRLFGDTLVLSNMGSIEFPRATRAALVELSIEGQGRIFWHQLHANANHVRFYLGPVA